MSYCDSLFNYRRRPSSTVHIGALTLGGEAPVRVQSMANTSTLDTPASVAQALDIIQAGGELVRFTAQGVREAGNLREIRSELRARDVDTPLVADIHFNPQAAFAAAGAVEKVRINPGNFADPIPQHIRQIADPQQRDQAVAAHIREQFVPFLDLCKQHHTAIRIGVNHGSMSARMTDRYGDTPQGLVASCMEYLRICVEEDFHEVVISIKASNTLVMVQTVRLLVDTMNREDMHFPLHLGVTEAGDGEDGRIKSAVGIGALLLDGIGDTIRVSLSEAPQAEIPVARALVDYVSRRQGHPPIEARPNGDLDPYRFHRRSTRGGSAKAGPYAGIGNGQAPVVIADFSDDDQTEEPVFEKDFQPDYIYIGSHPERAGRLHTAVSGAGLLCDADCVEDDCQGLLPVFVPARLTDLQASTAPQKFLRVGLADLTPDFIRALEAVEGLSLLLESRHRNAPAEMRAAFHTLMNAGCQLPVVLRLRYTDITLEQARIFAPADFGFLLLDGLGDGICLQVARQPAPALTRLMFGILQACRLRISKTEYISCPSCGRTLFDLQDTLARVKAGTSHLKGLKIAVMGCIVNGPGEMADADYGYVGAARGKVSLYKGRQCIEKNIPQEEALDRLLALIGQTRPSAS
ncbi:MAG: (E)-4-hydroxy-3-methylbut-2-enyl-diphosphate synthase [Bacteroidales bacterium]|nr:(E)-4-hydroxy-3-methylbut-2-enyl-diphosphate synthase [Bacteroidales bacterium]